MPRRVPTESLGRALCTRRGVTSSACGRRDRSVESLGCGDASGFCRIPHRQIGDRPPEPIIYQQATGVPRHYKTRKMPPGAADATKVGGPPAAEIITVSADAPPGDPGSPISAGQRLWLATPQGSSFGLYPAVEINLHLDRVCPAQPSSRAAFEYALRSLHRRYEPAPKHDVVSESVRR